MTPKYPRPQKPLHPVIEIAGYVWFMIIFIGMMYAFPVLEDLIK